MMTYPVCAFFLSREQWWAIPNPGRGGGGRGAGWGDGSVFEIFIWLREYLG